MADSPEWPSAPQLAAEIARAWQALPVHNTPAGRALRRRYSGQLQGAPAELVLAVARELLAHSDLRWMAYELIAAHRAAFQCLGDAEMQALGQGIDSWWTVDAFARTLAGPAWLRGQVSDDLILRWARSPDRWWRRAALVSTVALNMRSQGGPGDVPRTLAVCRLLAGDRDDMVYKALSWALRQLVVHDPAAVRAFLAEHHGAMAAQARREVLHKLATGLKNPRRGRANYQGTKAPGDQVS